MNTQEIGPGRIAGLLDIENIVMRDYGLLSEVDCTAAFRQVEHYLSGMPVRVALGERMAKSLLPHLSRQAGWGLTFVDSTPDAADKSLIEFGMNLAACGFTDLVVASGDGAFLELASYARLHVLAPTGQLSRKLQIAATSVTFLNPGVRPSRKTAS